MKHYNYGILLGVIIIFTACSASEQPQENKENMLTAQEKNEGWTLLFDGESTDGWRNFNSDSLIGWEVKDGNLLALGLGGDHAHDIITEGIYDDFDLYVDWKVESGANSGIFFNVREIKGIEAIYEVAPEYQIIDDEGWPGELKDWQKAGACYAMYAANENKKLNPVEEFNTSRIVVQDSTVEHYLNGEKILEYTMWSEDWKARVDTGKWKNYPMFGTTAKGHIGLQDHGKKIYFRNIRIKEL